MLLKTVIDTLSNEHAKRLVEIDDKLRTNPTRWKQQIRKLGIEATELLKNAIGARGEIADANSMSSRLRRYRVALKYHEMLSSPRYHGVLQELGDVLVTLNSQNQKLRNDDYVEKIANRLSSKREDHILIRPAKYLEQAYDILRAVDRGTMRYLDMSVRWQSVSCAIALVTGSRMSEIHGNATYKPIDDLSHYIEFSGRLKQKNSVTIGDGIEKIPTLIPAYLVIAGIKFLGKKDVATNYTGKAECRRFYSPDDVNKKLSSSLGREIRGEQFRNKKVLDWLVVPDEELISKGEKPFHYHTLRHCYAPCATAIISHDSNLPAIKKTAAMSMVLGQSNVNTLQLYGMFDLADGELFMIEE